MSFPLPNYTALTGNGRELKTLVVDTPSPEFFKYSGEWNLAYSGAEYNNQTGAYVCFSVSRKNAADL
jgi:hypothetical protein